MPIQSVVNKHHFTTLEQVGRMFKTKQEDSENPLHNIGKTKNQKISDLHITYMV